MKHDLPFPLDQIQRIAATEDHPVDLTAQLVRRALPESTTDQIIGIFQALGPPLAFFATREEEQFEVSDDENLKAVLEALESAGQCTVKNKKLGSGLVVTLK